MRIWSLHPSLLDAKGLVALWRETLLAQKVLEGRTKGYTRHPQLQRFRAQSDPLAAIGTYLHAVCDEAESRGYNFDRSKIVMMPSSMGIAVTSGQVRYECDHLKSKLLVRDPDRARVLDCAKEILLHPLFYSVEGGVEPWEII